MPFDCVNFIKAGPIRDPNVPGGAPMFRRRFTLTEPVEKAEVHVCGLGYGYYFLNGEPLDEPYISEKALGECDVEFPYQVPENSYFVMGDHRETSIDSRSSVIGCIAQDQLIGKIFCKVWPLSELEFMN